MGNEIEGVEARKVLRMIFGTNQEKGRWVRAVWEEALLEKYNL